MPGKQADTGTNRHTFVLRFPAGWGRLSWARSWFLVRGWCGLVSAAIDVRKQPHGTAQFGEAVATVVTPASIASTNVVIGPSQLLSNGQFQLTVNAGVLGQNYVLLASTNLMDWTPISGFVDTNPPVTIYAPDASKYPWRFYRIGPQSTAPVMQFGLNYAQPLISNGFNVVLYSLPGLNYEVQSSSNLIDWTTVTNFVSTNSPLYLSVPATTNTKEEFYRAVMP